jgi:hypothetical protein
MLANFCNLCLPCQLPKLKKHIYIGQMYISVIECEAKFMKHTSIFSIRICLGLRRYLAVEVASDDRDKKFRRDAHIQKTSIETHIYAHIS